MSSLQDEPLTPDDDVDRHLKGGKQQLHDDESAEIEAASFKKFPVEVNALTRVSVCMCTVEPLNVDTPEIRTPLKYGHFLVSQLWQFCPCIKHTPDSYLGPNGIGVPL